MFDKVVFAGGGHRGWWQAGFWDRVGSEIELHPRVIAGASFGAVIACLLHAGDSRRALAWYERELKSLRGNVNLLDLLRRDRRVMPSAAIQRKALRALLGGDSFRQLMWRAPEIRVQYARLPDDASASRAVLGALLARRLGRRADGRRAAAVAPRGGLVIEVKRIQDCRSERELVDLLAAATSAPPFTAAEVFDGSPCVDAGLGEELQLATVADVPGQTLVLGTRHDPSLAPVFARDGFVHAQPSRKVPVGGWDYSAARFQKAYDLGCHDGEAFLKTFALGQYCDPAALRPVTGSVAPAAGGSDPAGTGAPSVMEPGPMEPGQAQAQKAQDAQKGQKAQETSEGGPAGLAVVAPGSTGKEPAASAHEAVTQDHGGEADAGKSRPAPGQPGLPPRRTAPRSAAVPPRSTPLRPAAGARDDLFPPMHAIDHDDRDDGGVLDVSAKLAAYREAAGDQGPARDEVDYKEPTDAGMADDLRASQPAASDGQARSGRSLRASNT